MLDPAEIAPAKLRPLLRPLLRREYDRLVDLGVFGDQRIELLRGHLVEMSPQGDEHSDAVWWLCHHLSRLLDPAHWEVRPQLPFAATADSEPEPDIYVTRHRRRRGHPRIAELVIEVAKSSLRIDRVIKRSIYAEARVPEYWIIDVNARSIEVFTNPKAGDYTKVVEVDRSGILRPKHVPNVRLIVANIPGFGKRRARRSSRG
ncbi:MAG TPA: Uma2 family endonuclease [Kofleriaceae bacterium]|nr:Uma2 family endonuclease [Kofleriaceae bacterium]